MLILSLFCVYSFSGNLSSEPSTKTDIKLLIQTMEKRFEAMDKRFEVIDKRFETIEKRFEIIDKRIDFLQNLLLAVFSWVLASPFLNVVVLRELVQKDTKIARAMEIAGLK